MRDQNDAIARWIGVNIDIDDQRRADDAREMFVALIENSDDFVGIATVEGRVMYANAAGRRLLDIESAEAAIAAESREYFMPADRELMRTQILPAIAQDGHWVGDFRLRNLKTGKAIPVAYNVFNVVGRDGSILGIATVSRDRREAERVDSGLRLLAQTGAAELDTLDLPTVLQNIAATFAREFASYCVIDVLNVDGSSARWCIAIRRARRRFARSLRRRAIIRVPARYVTARPR